MKICNLLLAFFICFATFSSYAAEVTLSVDKKVITDGDTVRLTINYNGDSSQKPDISALQQDFQIVSRSSSSAVNFINGQISQNKQWILGLKPKKTGKITIKPISIDGISSNYAEVEVKELSDVAYVPDSKENINSPYFQIEQSVYPTSPYVQQQMIILVTVYDSIGMQNGMMNISENTLNDWSIVSLSDKPFVKQDVINGKKMNVATFAFAAFPQRSGELTTPNISFEGYYLKNNDIDLEEFEDFFTLGFGFKNILGQKVPVRMKTKSEKVMVKPIPETYAGKYWLPLIDLKTEANLLGNENFKIGDAISRKLKITAVGTTKNMIPQLKFPETPFFKQYPENPEITEQVIDGNIVTTATFNVVYIPTTAGKQTIPSLEIDWFNVKTEQLEKTIIPADDVFIEGDVVSVQSSGTTVLPSAQQQVKESALPVNTEEPLKISFDVRYFYFLLLLVPLFFFFLRKPKNPYSALVISSIKRHDYKAARSYLIDWAKIKFVQPDIKNLNMIADIVQNNDFSAQLAQLNKFMYSPKDEIFNGTKFIEIFKKTDKLKLKKQKHQNVLPNLYD